MQEQTRNSRIIGGLEPRPIPTTPDSRGRHRKIAELKRLEEEISLLEEELKDLVQADRVSTVCKEVLLTMESRPDPLLPTSRGPEDPEWNRWSEGTVESQSCCCCL